MELKKLPALYDSTRQNGQVLVGSDDAAALLEASSDGDFPKIREMLQRKDQRDIALAKPHRIYHADPPGRVLARPILNLETMIGRAVTGQHAACVTALIAWGVEQKIPQTQLLDRFLILQVLRCDDEKFTVLGALADIDPSVLRMHLHHSRTVPDYALHRPALLRFLLKRGVTLAEFETACPNRPLDKVVAELRDMEASSSGQGQSH